MQEDSTAGLMLTFANSVFFYFSEFYLLCLLCSNDVFHASACTLVISRFSGTVIKKLMELLCYYSVISADWTGLD